MYSFPFKSYLTTFSMNSINAVCVICDGNLDLFPCGGSTSTSHLQTSPCLGDPLCPDPGAWVHADPSSVVGVGTALGLPGGRGLGGRGGAGAAWAVPLRLPVALGWL